MEKIRAKEKGGVLHGQQKTKPNVRKKGQLGTHCNYKKHLPVMRAEQMRRG